MGEGRIYSESEIQDSFDHLTEFLAQGELASMEKVLAQDGLSLIATIRDRDKTIAELKNQLEKVDSLFKTHMVHTVRMVDAETVAKLQDEKIAPTP
ncbi:hypothetical protein LLE49_19620 [Alicyclobacillus tolerans]|uniref:hypothetical protein n=1 Tax=Alicyclobacillus tolerans TaxID=90970 RepID=UPI001F1934EE|nr:hypothetical protein [Alicyclobacillus tolerans]MCF8566932.1 hypothetical protein [Alicyclobacillus tolerans]